MQKLPFVNYRRNWIISACTHAGLIAELYTYRIAGYFRGVYISRTSREHSQSLKIECGGGAVQYRHSDFLRTRIELAVRKI